VTIGFYNEVAISRVLACGGTGATTGRRCGDGGEVTDEGTRGRPRQDRRKSPPGRLSETGQTEITLMEAHLFGIHSNGLH
jgi:hypothetical protein